LGSKTSKKPASGKAAFRRNIDMELKNFSVGPSTCLADTILPGINYLKGQPPVVALADEQYPEWLWTILQPKVLEDDGPGGKFERAKRRTANRQAIKDRNFMLTQ
jgi:large subunit ribosomal protein L54